MPATRSTYFLSFFATPPLQSPPSPYILSSCSSAAWNMFMQFAEQPSNWKIGLLAAGGASCPAGWLAGGPLVLSNDFIYAMGAHVCAIIGLFTFAA